jgi:hypothetical protein
MQDECYASTSYSTPCRNYKHGSLHMEQNTWLPSWVGALNIAFTAPWLLIVEVTSCGFVGVV